MLFVTECKRAGYSGSLRNTPVSDAEQGWRHILEVLSAEYEGRNGEFFMTENGCRSTGNIFPEVSFEIREATPLDRVYI